MITVLDPSGLALLSIHSALSPKTPKELLHGTAIPWARVISLKEFALALGSAVGLMLQGFFFKSLEFWMHPGEGAEQMNLQLFGISEPRKGLPTGTRSVVNV